MFLAMKRASLILPLALALAGGGIRLPARADDVLPRPAAADRYQKMAERSPFAPPTLGPATQVAPPPPPGPKWSDNLTVTLVTQLGGVYYATILDKAKNERFLLQSNKEDLDRQLALTSIEWGALVSQTTVTLRHNNEFAPVHFDPNAPAATPAALPARGPVPGTYPTDGGCAAARPLAAPAESSGHAGQHPAARPDPYHPDGDGPFAPLAAERVAPPPDQPERRHRPIDGRRELRCRGERRYCSTRWMSSK